MRNWILFVGVVTMWAGGVWYASDDMMNTYRCAFDSLVTAGVLSESVYDDNNNSSAELLFVGDIMLSRAVGSGMTRMNDWAFPFRLVESRLRTADVVVANLEGPISDLGSNQGSIYSFRADPRVMEGLLVGGIDVVSLANNHMWDWGRSALLDTIDRLMAVGIEPIGAGENSAVAGRVAVVERNGITIAFVAATNLYPNSLVADAVSAGVNDFVLEDMKQTVRVIRESGVADIVVVSLHWGAEYAVHPEPWQVEAARALIDAGANIIAGHHPHVVQDVEEYNDGIIFYSLGNFIFDQNFSEETMSSIAGSVVVSNDGIVAFETIPVRINDVYQPYVDDDVVQQ